MVLVIVNAKLFVKNMVHAFRIYYCIEHKSNGIAAAIVVASITISGEGSTVRVKAYFGNMINDSFHFFTTSPKIAAPKEMVQGMTFISIYLYLY